MYSKVKNTYTLKTKSPPLCDPAYCQDIRTDCLCKDPGCDPVMCKIYCGADKKCAANCARCPGIETPWECKSNVCTDVGKSNGKYATKKECIYDCSKPSWDCFPNTCADLRKGTGQYATKEECMTGCGFCWPKAQPSTTTGPYACDPKACHQDDLFCGQWNSYKSDNKISSSLCVSNKPSQPRTCLGAQGKSVLLYDQDGRQAEMPYSMWLEQGRNNKKTNRF